MKIALFGATGTIGQRILQEALRRGHDVTAIARDPSHLDGQQSPRLRVVAGDILDMHSVAAQIVGQDVVVSAYGPREEAPQTVVYASRSLIGGLTSAGVKRLVVVGGAGSLEVAPGVLLIDSPQFPEAWKGIALAHADALKVYQMEAGGLDWTSVSPPALIEPGERTSKFRLGTDQLLTDAQGQSRISAEDFAIALLDEVEKPQHVKQRFTVAY